MAVHLRHEITDQMLLDLYKQKESAFLVTKKHLEEAQQRLTELDEEIGTFKNWVVEVVEKYKYPTEELPSLTELDKERVAYLQQHKEFKELYVKASALAYRNLETIHFLQPAFRIESEEKYFKDNAPDFHRQMLESDQICLKRAKILSDMFTNVVHRKSVTLALIEQRSLTNALEEFRSLIENRKTQRSRFAPLLNYLPSYVAAPLIPKPSPEPAKIRDPLKRAALTPLNIAAIPPYKPADSPPSHRRVSEPTAKQLQRSGSHRFPLFSTSGSSPRSLQISSEVSTSSPRQEPFFPTQADRHRREAADSWESISIGASSALKSASSREGSPRESPHKRRDVKMMSPREMSPARRRLDRHGGSPREIASPRYYRQSGLASPRGVSPARSYKDRDWHVTITDREMHPARRDTQEKSSEQTRISSKSAPREPRYRPTSDRRPELEEKRHRYSMRPSIQYEDEKTYHR